MGLVHIPNVIIMLNSLTHSLGYILRLRDIFWSLLPLENCLTSGVYSVILFALK